MNRSKLRSSQVNQPEGFYIVCNKYGAEEARALFKKAEAGDINAQLTLANCFMDATEQPYALPWYEKAADAGSSQAFHELTYFYEGQYIGVDADPIKAEKARNEALKMNNPDAIFKLASHYDAGYGVEENKEKAFHYYMKAAKLGNDRAMAEVGLCYLNGKGVKQNDVQAFEWLSHSRDDLYGYYYLAQCYLKGIGTEKNIEKAVPLLEKAVENKCMDLYEARNQLVDLYEKGYGGSNSSIKLKKVKEDIARSDKIIDDLATLMHLEKDQ